MPGYMEINVISRVGALAGLPPGVLPCLCLPVSRLHLCVTTSAPAGLPLGTPTSPRPRPLVCPLACSRAPRSHLPAGLCLLVRRPASGVRVPSCPLASKNAKSLRYNSDAVVLPKRARHLPGMMQTANMAKRGSAASSQIITQTFDVFRESLGCTRLQQRGNNRVPMPGTLRLAVVPVPIDETDALKFGVGLDLLVNPADVGSPGAFESARLCLCARWPAPTGLPAPPRPPARACWPTCAPALASLLVPPRPSACVPAPACSDFFDFPQICAMRPREAVFFWLKEGRQGDLRQRNAIDAGRPANVQR